jgi:hypothetical protein
MQPIFAALEPFIVNAVEPIATLFWGVALVLLSSKLQASRVSGAQHRTAGDQAAAPAQFVIVPGRTGGEDLLHMPIDGVGLRSQTR